MSVGKKIKKIRENKGLTQSELANKCGILYQTIGKYERDVLNPKIETIKKIAKALEVNYLELLENDIVNNAKDKVKLINPWNHDWILIYSGLYQTYKDNLDDYMNWYLETEKQIKRQLYNLENIKLDFNIPFENYEDYFDWHDKKPFSEQINYLEGLLTDLEEMTRSMNDILCDEQNNSLNITDYVLDTTDKKRKALLELGSDSLYLDDKELYNDYYKTATDEEIEKQFKKLVNRLRLENDKLKKELDKIYNENMKNSLWNLLDEDKKKD